MALISCPECGKKVSYKAKFCIHCGYPIKEKIEELKEIEGEEKDGLIECEEEIDKKIYKHQKEEGFKYGYCLCAICTFFLMFGLGACVIGVALSSSDEKGEQEMQEVNNTVEENADEVVETLNTKDEKQIITEELIKEDKVVENYLEDIKLKEDSIRDEEYFKSNCIDVVYNDLDEMWIGKWVTKEILFNEPKETKYRCASTESYVEENSGYQRAYAIYDITDCRFDNSLPIYSGDVIRIYGVITDIKMNLANGKNFPIIDMYYVDYIRRWKKTVDSTKTIEELIDERNAEQEKIKAENEYYNSLNSDYTGQTKNVENMENLTKDDFKNYCDSMNFRNMVDSTEDLTGRYIKIHIQLMHGQRFQFEEGKREHLGSLVDTYSISDNVWLGKLLYERTEEYIGELIRFYFVDNGTYNIENLKKEQELVVYGMVLNYEINKGFHNEFDFLVVYIDE